MKNFENRLRAIEKIANGKTAKIAFLDYKDGKYYQDGKRVDISTVKADAIIVDDISCDEDLSVPPAPPEFLEKGSDEEWQENESVTKE